MAVDWKCYLYATLRFVPDPVRGEFANIGLVVVPLNDNVDWSLVVNARSGPLSLSESQQQLWLAALSQAQQLLPLPEGPPTAAWLRDCYVHSQGALQFSAPEPVLAASAQAALTKLFPLFLGVEPPTPPPEQQSDLADEVQRHCQRRTIADEQASALKLQQLLADRHDVLTGMAQLLQQFIDLRDERGGWRT